MDSVVIVGGGIIGTSVAFHLRDHPDVTVLEKNALGSGTTAASMGRFDWDVADPFGVFLQREAWRTYEPLVRDGVVDFERPGYLRVAGTPDELERMRERAAVLGEYGLDFELLDADETAEHGVNPDAVSGGLYQASGGYLNQQDAVEYFAEGAREAGVAIETGTEVTDVLTDGGTVTAVETTDGRYTADVVVNAAGPWAPGLNELVDVSLPLRHTTGPILVLEGDGPVSIPFLKNVDGDFYVRPEGGSKLLAGRRWGRYDEAPLLDPDDARGVDDRFRRDVAALSESHLPALEGAAVVNEWVGLRTVTPDFRPVVGPTARDGFLVACGMSGSGVGLAPLVGRLVADHVDDDGNGTLLRQLSARRFGSGTAPS